MSDQIEHPTAKGMRQKISLQIKTIEMLGKDRGLLEKHLEDALAENERLREALGGVIRIADRDCPEFRKARAALEEKK